MRIAILSWESLYSIHVGGLGVIVTRMAEELARRGHEVYLFTRWREEYPRHSKINGVHYYRCVFDPGKNILEFFTNMSRAMLNELGRVMRGSGAFDIFHGHDWHVVDALFELKKRGHPIVISYHSTEYSRRGGRMGEDRLFREICARESLGGQIANRVITVSRTMRRELVKVCKIPEEKIDVVPNAITPSKYRISVDVKKVKKKYGIPQDVRTILFMGRLEYQKGPDLLLEAVPEVIKRHDNVLFLFAGTGTMSRRLKRRARKYELMEKVKFLGWIPYRKYVNLLNICDVMCIPSRQEPFGIVLLEGWATGRPMVVTNVGGLNENVKHLVNGIKVSPNPRSIARGICYVLEHPRVAKRISENGRKSVKKFTWRATIKKLLRVYERALAE